MHQGQAIQARARSARLLVFASALILVVILVAFVSIQLRPKVVATETLADGTEISLLGQTYGDRSFDPAPPLLRALSDLRVPVKLPERQLVQDPGKRTHLWFSTRLGNGTTRIQRDLLSGALFQDEHGCVVQARMNHNWGLHESHKDLDQLPLPFESVEDSVRTVKLREEFEPEKQLAQFQIRTRGHGLAAETGIKPNALPISVSTNRVSATLKRLIHVEKGPTPYSAAHITVLDRAYPKHPWRAEEVDAFDRFGQRSKSNDGELSQPWIDAGTPFHGLCRREPYWRLRARLFPDMAGPRPSDYTWGTFHLEIDPTHPDSQSLKVVVKTSQGAELKVGTQGIVSANSPGDIDPQNVVRLRITLTVRGVDRPVRIRLTRVNGVAALEWYRTLKADTWESESSYSQPGEPDVISLPIGPRTSKLNLEFEGFRSESVEFIVKP